MNYTFPLDELFRQGLIAEEALFEFLFSPAVLLAVFESDFATSAGKGTDRLNGFQFSARAGKELAVVSEKCLQGRYRFAPFLEVLKTKGRNKSPRLIGIPTIRDRVVLSQLNKFLAAIFPERVPRNIASSYVKALSEDLTQRDPEQTWVCSTDIMTFYDSIQRPKLLKTLGVRVKQDAPRLLIEHALNTPTVPKNTPRKRHAEFRLSEGVPQGLAISNILASIYMQGVDEAMAKQGVAYYRYVDDVVMYGDKEPVEAALRSLTARLRPRGLALHPKGSGKTNIASLSKPFGYLGYFFKMPHITVREATVERFLQSIAAKFSDYAHNKARRLEKFKYLSAERLAEIFLMELNERITGAISERKRYGWISYFNQINDLSLLYRLDHAIAGFFVRLPDFGRIAPLGLCKLSRSYFEMKFNPEGGYVRNYDKVITRAQKLDLLRSRGRVSDDETLSDEQIEDRYSAYLRHVLAAMHGDEAIIYG